MWPLRSLWKKNIYIKNPRELMTWPKKWHLSPLLTSNCLVICLQAINKEYWVTWIFSILRNKNQTEIAEENSIGFIALWDFFLTFKCLWYIVNVFRIFIIFLRFKWEIVYKIISITPATYWTINKYWIPILILPK